MTNEQHDQHVLKDNELVRSSVPEVIRKLIAVELEEKESYNNNYSQDKEVI